jgi:hypothetical protein
LVVSVSNSTCTLPTIVAPTATSASDFARVFVQARERADPLVLGEQAGTPSRPIRFTGHSDPGRWTARVTNPSHGAWKR